MKPRFEAISYEVKQMLEKAEKMNSRLELLEKGKCDCGKKPCECKDCPKCGSKMNKMGGCMKMDCGGKKAKAEKCPKCGSKMNKMCGCGGKMAKAEKCPSCGGKMEKGGCMKMECNKMAKAAIEDPKPLPKEKITDVNPHLVTESGGQTKTSYYTTNGNTIEYEDGKPKRAKHDKKVDLGKLGGRMNPHAGTGAEREDAEGGSERRY